MEFVILDHLQEYIYLSQSQLHQGLAELEQLVLDI